MIDIMVRIGPLRIELNTRWKYALVGGFASIPMTTASYWQTGSEISVSGVLLGGLLAGYLAKRKLGSSHGVGLRAGFVGALPVLWVVYNVLRAATALSGPTWFILSGIGLTVLTLAAFAVLSVGLSGIVGEVGGRIGGWLAGSVDQRPSPATGS